MGADVRLSKDAYDGAKRTRSVRALDRLRTLLLFLRELIFLAVRPASLCRTAPMAQPARCSAFVRCLELCLIFPF